ncbi:MAG TPA: asparagine synthase (glutamine-hydrolyzing), partial [Solirubrobacteraceae bacterium]|nr:asparagine synthase (glutamine-hydrolyzing) [Solirubrobacteraceae bacterium]
RVGHNLATAGDTEVIVHLAEELSPVELATSLEGMFAFAVWDERRRRLVLARDRFGKKPLFWWYGAGTLVFASEIKALFAHPAVPRLLNEHAIVPYLTFGYAPTPETFYAGVHSLAPGHVLTLTSGGEPVITEYWRPPLPPSRSSGVRSPTLPEAVSDTRELVRTAVERRLISDVPLGAFLSGGVDSTVVVATMASLDRAPVQTFTVGFEDDEGFDERRYARMVARRYRTDHVEFVVRPKAIDLIEKLLWHHDQPFGDSSAIPTYLLSECTRGQVTVALSGDGGDELFAGYERFAASLVFANYLLLPRQVRRAVARAADRLPPASRKSRVDSIRRLLSSGDADLLSTFANWVAYFPEPVRAEMIGSRVEGERSLREYRAVWAGSAGQRLLARLLDLNARTYLVDDLLVKTDRMSMAHGLEVRSPFLDHQLADYIFRLPRSLKVPGLRLKYLLRRAFAAEIPEPILTRRKQGFAIPLDRWFRTDLHSYADSMLGPGARVREHLNPGAIDEVLASHQSGRRNYGNGIWALLTLELFLRRENW